MCECFPDISTQTKEELRKLIQRKELYSNWLFSINQSTSTILQGDVVKDLPVFILGRNGKLRKKDLPVLLLNHDCDMQIDDSIPRSEFISFIPLLPFKEYIQHFRGIQQHSIDVRNNIITNKFYVSTLPKESEDYVADLGLISSIDSCYFHEKMREGSIKKVAELSFNGYYYYLAKLTLHFMRRETQDVIREKLSLKVEEKSH
jgi:hypothetical protein